MGFILLIISWFLRTYGAIQENRDILSKPLIWQNNTFSLILITIWILLLLSGLYLVFLSSGFVLTIACILIYFVIAPLFTPLVKKLLDKVNF